MTPEQLLPVALATIGIVITALLSGGGVALVILRIVNDLHKSPLLMQALDQLAMSIPVEYVKAIHDTSELVADATDQDPTNDGKGA